MASPPYLVPSSSAAMKRSAQSSSMILGLTSSRTTCCEYDRWEVCADERFGAAAGEGRGNDPLPPRDARRPEG